MRIVAVLMTVALAAVTALAQQNVPPPPQPASDMPATANGPSLDVTLKFIQDKVNEQGKIVYVESETNSITGERVNENSQARSAKLAGPSFGRAPAKKGSAGAGGGASPDQFAETAVVSYDPAGVITFQELGTKTEVQKSGLLMLPVTENWTKTWPANFKNVEKLEVLSSADYRHRVNPAMTYQDDPPYFELVVHFASGKFVTRHTQTVSGNKHGKTTESDDSIREFALHFRDEDSANRVAKAMIHAIELCGGGSQPEPF
jgi:hypothetical protein